MRHHDLVLAAGVEWHGACDGLVEDHAQRIEIRLPVERGHTLDLLRRHILGYADGGSSLREVGIGGCLGHAKAAQHSPLVRGNQYVGRGDIPMHGCLFMGIA